MYISLSEDEKSSYASQQPIYESESYIYELINAPEFESDLDSVDNGKLYFTNIKRERKTDEKISLNAMNITQPSTSKIFKEKKKGKIFIIKKVRHLGRKRKNKKSTKEPNHSKFSKDNIMTKIKKDLSKNCLDFINSLLEKKDKDKKKKIRLKKIDTSILKECQKIKNERLLKMPLKELFSQDISNKFTNSKKDENKKKIDLILKQNDKELNEVLNRNVEFMLKLYSEPKVEDSIYGSFNRITDNKKLLEDEEYFNEYKKILQNFQEIINKIIPRNKKQKK